MPGLLRHICSVAGCCSGSQGCRGQHRAGQEVLGAAAGEWGRRSLPPARQGLGANLAMPAGAAVPASCLCHGILRLQELRLCKGAPADLVRCGGSQGTHEVPSCSSTR